jgi:hypothetical protein
MAGAAGAGHLLPPTTPRPPSAAAVPCGCSAARPRGPVQATFRDERCDAHAQVTAVTRGVGRGHAGGLGAAHRASRAGTAVSRLLAVRVLWRVSTEGHQDPVTSLARQREQAATLVAGQGRSSRSSPTSGRAGPCRGRAAALVAALADPDLRPSHPDLSGQAPKTPQPSPPTSIADQPKAPASEKGSKPARRTPAAAGGHFRS